MQKAIVRKPRLFTEGNLFGVSSTIQVPDREFTLFYKASKGPLLPSIEPFFAAALLPAMRAHVPLHLEGPVSGRLLKAAKQIQDIYHIWDEEFLPISITADAETDAVQSPGRGVASFLSGGVDSFYTILKHLDEIDQLITLHGFVFRLADRDVQAEHAGSLREVARELGKPLVEVETNIQDVTEGLVDWKLMGAAVLSSLAALMAPFVRMVYLPATHTYAQHIDPSLPPWGSHPLLDPLWSTEAVEIIHDGCEATRYDKARLLGTSATALRHLRVCFGYREAHNKGIYNCGHCEKCLRTHVALYLAGVLDRCETFPKTLDLDLVANIPNGSQYARLFINENLEHAERLHADPALIAALRHALTRPRPGEQAIAEGADSLDDRQRLEAENQTLKSTVRALYQSRSWRLTAPLRTLGDMARRLRS